MEALDNVCYGSWRPLTNLTQTFRACHLRTFNVAAIFFRGHPYIWHTTVHHDSMGLLKTAEGHTDVVPLLLSMFITVIVLFCLMFLRRASLPSWSPVTVVILMLYHFCSPVGPRWTCRTRWDTSTSHSNHCKARGLYYLSLCATTPAVFTHTAPNGQAAFFLTYKCCQHKVS